MKRLFLTLCLFFLGTHAHAQTRPILPASMTTLWTVQGTTLDNGTCAYATPCAHIHEAIDLLQSYDLNGQNVTIYACAKLQNGQVVSAATPANPIVWPEGFQLGTRFVGQNAGPAQFRIIGDPSGASGACILRPQIGGGNAIDANYGANAEIAGFKCDMQSQGVDCASVAQADTDIFFGSFIFGDVTNPGDDLTVTAGEVHFLTGYGIEKTTYNVQLAFAANSQYLVLLSGSPPPLGTIIHGPALPPRCFVTAYANSQITVTCSTLSAQSNVTEQVSTGGQAHISVAQGGRVYYDTNGGQAPINVAMSGYPTYYTALYTVFLNATATLGATYSGSCSGYVASVESGGRIFSGGTVGPGDLTCDAGVQNDGTGTVN